MWVKRVDGELAAGSLGVQASEPAILVGWQADLLAEFFPGAAVICF